MTKINTVVVLRNGGLYGVWSFPGNINLSVSKKNDIRHLIMEKVKEMCTEDVFSISFDDTYVTDDMSELVEGITATIENSYD